MPGVPGVCGVTGVCGSCGSSPGVTGVTGSSPPGLAGVESPPSAQVADELPSTPTDVPQTSTGTVIGALTNEPSELADPEPVVGELPEPQSELALPNTATDVPHTFTGTLIGALTTACFVFAGTGESPAVGDESDGVDVGPELADWDCDDFALPSTATLVPFTDTGTLTGAFATLWLAFELDVLLDDFDLAWWPRSTLAGT